MNNKNIFYALSLALIMGACGNRQKFELPETQKSGKLDTVRVVGAYTQSSFLYLPMVTYFDFVTKTGGVYSCRFKSNMMKTNFRDAKLPYINAGDTIVMRNGRVINNLTLDRLAYEYVNGR